jgi:hypothetical protein
MIAAKCVTLLNQRIIKRTEIFCIEEQQAHDDGIDGSIVGCPPSFSQTRRKKKEYAISSHFAKKLFVHVPCLTKNKDLKGTFRTRSVQVSGLLIILVHFVDG